MTQKKLVPVLLILLLIAAACDEQSAATATLAPPPTVTVAGPTTAPDSTQTSAPPTTPVETPQSPTATAESPVDGDPTPTLAAEVTATVEPSPEPEAAFAVEEPAAGAVLALGESFTVRGTASGATEAISAALRAAGLVLASAETTSSGGNWEMTMEVPQTVAGAAVLEVSAGDEPATEIAVQLAPSGATSGPAIALDYPQPDSTVVSGQVLFFTGSVQRPPEETLTIAVLFEDCQTVASTTSFNVGEGGQWWGYLVVPETVFGPACAVAYLGEFDGPDWRAAHAPVDILEQDDPQARGLFIGNFAGSDLTPGDSTTVYGSAYNVPDRQVQVSLQVDGATVAQGTTSTDSFGYWEINLALPSDVAGAASGQFGATVSYNGDEVGETVPFDIVSE